MTDWLQLTVILEADSADIKIFQTNVYTKCGCVGGEENMGLGELDN